MLRLVLIILVVLPQMVSAQLFNMEMKSHVDGMPGNAYNDVWGYVKNGQEYAIIGSSQAINIYNVTNCGSPQYVWSKIDGSTVTWRDFKTYRNYAYGVCDGACTEGLEIINLDNYYFSQNVATFTKAHNIYIDTAYARLYVVGSNATNGQMLIYGLDSIPGVRGPGTPQLLKAFTTSYIHDIYVKNNIAYASHGYSQYKIWDVSDVNNITELASYTPVTSSCSSCYNHSSWVTSDGYAYVAEELPRGQPIRILKITGSGLGTAISQEGTFKEALEQPISDQCRPHNPFVLDNKLYISYYENGLQVFDITNRSNPTRIAYADTYLGQNGLGYPSNQDWKGHWGVYPYLPSGCLISSDITQGLYTFRLDLPTNSGANVDGLSRVENADFYCETVAKSVMLRSPEGNCFRLDIGPTGNIITTQVVCHKVNETTTSLEHQDLYITNETKGLVIKDASNNCYRIQSSGIGLSAAAVLCSSVSGSSVKVSDDFKIGTYTKGIIMKGPQNRCYKTTVNNAGVLQTVLLNVCP